MNIQQQYKELAQSLSTFWRAYGGITAWVTSPYLHLGVFLGLLSFRDWGTAWWDLVIDVLPGLIGFTLGGYAILIAFGDEKFRALLTGASKRDQASPFVTISATFMHFILTQILSLLFAIMARQICSPSVDFTAEEGAKVCALQFAGSDIIYSLLAFIGLSAFFYSIALAISATLAIFQMSIWYDMAKPDDLD